MVNCFRFLNNDMHFDDKALTVLLRVLSDDDKEYREKWWTEVRACRRRKQESLGEGTYVLFSMDVLVFDYLFDNIFVVV
jgi:hypothetical protein